MHSCVPAADNRAIIFATTADGLRLPITDVTHPVFAIPDDPASLAARRDAFLAWDRRNRRLPWIVAARVTCSAPLAAAPDDHGVYRRDAFSHLVSGGRATAPTI